MSNGSSQGNQFHGAAESANQRTDTGASTDLAVLSAKLKEYHILAIGLSGVIGAGALIDTGTSLQVAGPIATITSYGFVALVAIAVMECIAEMVGTWPIANPFVVFVETFIDQDLGFVVGVAYWYTYAMGFQTLLVATANLTDFWGMSSILKGLVLFVVCPGFLVAINLYSVLAFANVELVAGILKLLFVFITFIIMVCVNAGALGNHMHIGSTYIDDGWQHNPIVVKSMLAGLSESIVIAAFAFIGVEITAVTAFESKTKSDLRRPVKFIAWVTGAIYIATVSILVSNVKWCNEHLPRIWDQKMAPESLQCSGELQPRDTSFTNISHPHSELLVKGYGVSAATIALRNADSPAAAGFVNGFLIFAVISAANTALYVASRTLFGQTRKLKPERGNDTYLEYRAKSFFSTFGTVHRSTQVPAWALVASWLVFAWIPFIELNAGRTLLDVQEILSTLGSVACVLTWASQCAAFLAYFYWLRTHRKDLADSGLARLDRWGRYEEHDQVNTWLGFMQPLPAWFGLCACLVIALVLTTSTWWDGQVTWKRGVSVYLFPVVMLVLYLARKVRSQRWRFFNHEWKWRQLVERMNQLDNAARERTGERIEMNAV